MSEAGEIIKSGAAEKLADLIHKLAGPMSEELGLMMGDKVRAYRIKNWIRVAGKTERILKAADLPPNAVPPRMFIPILEASSVEGDEVLQDLWAGLLASASEESDSLSPSFVETLKQLTPSQAIALEGLFDFAQAQPVFNIRTRPDLTGWFLTAVDADASQLEAEAFERLGLIRRHYDLQPPYKAQYVISNSINHLLSSEFAPVSSEYSAYLTPINIPSEFAGDQDKMPKLTSRLEFTEYGVQFMRACKGPHKRSEGPD